jgi:hypothetical protein
MAVRTKRARMLYKLLYLLGPENEKYLKDDGREPYSFTGAVDQTLKIFTYRFWSGPRKDYDKAKEQLLKDYANLISQISDNMFK